MNSYLHPERYVLKIEKEVNGRKFAVSQLVDASLYDSDPEFFESVRARLRSEFAVALAASLDLVVTREDFDF